MANQFLSIIANLDAPALSVLMRDAELALRLQEAFKAAQSAEKGAKDAASEDR